MPNTKDFATARELHGTASGLPRTVDKTLEARHNRYGTFLMNAAIAQQLKDTMRGAPKWDQLEDDQREALDQIASKISRILTGDVNYVDSWHDLAGYPTLVEKRLNGEEL
jgi:hypothetical protein